METKVSGVAPVGSGKENTRQGYDASALAYKRSVAPIYRPLAQRLVALLELGPGVRCLDIASGTGIIPASVLSKQARAVVVALDLSRGMLLQAEGGWRISRVEADGERLPFADGSFDVVTCGFGLKFLPDLARALAEVRRVLRPNGLFASYTWAWSRPYRLPSIFKRTLDELLGPLPADPEAQEREQLIGTPSRLRQLLKSSGFQPQYLKTEEHLMQFRHFDHFWKWRAALPSARKRLARLSAAERSQFRRLLARRLERFEENGKLGDAWRVVFAVACGFPKIRP